MNTQEGKAIAWIMRTMTTAGVGLLITMAWTLSQEIKVQNIKIDRNTSAIETILEVILKDGSEKPPNKN